MVTVADIMALDVFRNVAQVAPCPGAERRRVRNVGILDCPPEINGYSAYEPGELIITNLGFAYHDASLSERSLLAMIERGVSGIAVKRVYDPQISEAVRQASTASGVPVYLYDGAYHEAVATAARELIEADEAEERTCALVDSLLSPQPACPAEEVLMDLAGCAGPAVRCLAIAARTPGTSPRAALDSLAQRLGEVRARSSQVDEAVALPYRDRVLVLVFRDPRAHYLERGVALDDATIEVERLVRSRPHLACGVGEEVEAEGADLTFRQAVLALDAALSDGSPCHEWGEGGIGTFRSVASQSRLFSSVSQSCQGRLARYDVLLLDTMRSLAANFGDVRATAEELGTHPNTVRYRLRKAKELLGQQDASDREFAFYLGLVFLA